MSGNGKANGRKPAPAEPPANPPHRPPIPLTDQDYVTAAKLARTCTQSIIAIALHMSQRTLERRKKSDPRLVAALELGRSEAAKGVGQALLIKALAGDVQAIRYWELTRLGVNPSLVVAGDPEHPLQFADLSPVEKFERLKAMVLAHIGPEGVQRKEA